MSFPPAQRLRRKAPGYVLLTCTNLVWVLLTLREWDVNAELDSFKGGIKVADTLVRLHIPNGGGRRRKTTTVVTSPHPR
ncbi:hypothetical protein BDZ89DRAFT_1080642 [Hymenopellis radicata]|nr:hypothetical protein BDZ89DRAFT_1080642 [Hymenopellis radicata]